MHIIKGLGVGRRHHQAEQSSRTSSIGLPSKSPLRRLHISPKQRTPSNRPTRRAVRYITMQPLLGRRQQLTRQPSEMRRNPEYTDLELETHQGDGKQCCIPPNMA